MLSFQNQNELGVHYVNVQYKLIIGECSLMVINLTILQDKVDETFWATIYFSGSIKEVKLKLILIRNCV